jgi:hypothetical protein
METTLVDRPNSRASSNLPLNMMSMALALTSDQVQDNTDATDLPYSAIFSTSTALLLLFKILQIILNV